MSDVRRFDHLEQVIRDLRRRVEDLESTVMARMATHTHAQDQVVGLPAALAAKANSADLDNVAFSGAYSDLSGLPFIPNSPDDIGAAFEGHTH